MGRFLAGVVATAVVGLAVGCSEGNDRDDGGRKGGQPAPGFDREAAAEEWVQLDQECRDRSVAACGERDVLAEQIFAEETTAFQTAWRELDRATAAALSSEQLLADPGFDLDQLLALVPEERNLDCVDEREDLGLGCWQTVSEADGTRRDVYLIFRLNQGRVTLDSWRSDV